MKPGPWCHEKGIREELAWCAGFFAGEGSTTLTVDKRKPNYHPGLRLSVCQSGEYALPLLEKFTQAFGGNINPYKERGHRNAGYMWQLSTFEGAQAAIAAMWLWLGPAKRIQATKCLLELRNADRDHRKDKKWSDEDIRAAHQLWKSGQHTQWDLANALNIHRDTLRLAFSRLGL